MIALILGLVFGLRNILALEFSRPVKLNNFALEIVTPKDANVYFDIGSQIISNKAYNITLGSEHMYLGMIFQLELVDYDPKLGRKYWFAKNHLQNEKGIKSFTPFNGGYIAQMKYGDIYYYFKQIRKNKMVVVYSLSSLADTKKFAKTIVNVKADSTKVDEYAKKVK